MIKLSNKLRVLYFLVFVGLICSSWESVFAQYPRTSGSGTLCKGDGITWVPFGGGPSATRPGLWTVVQGSGTFSDPNYHDNNLVISNIGFGTNIYDFWENSLGLIEHKLTIINYQVNAGRDTTLCYTVTSYQLNGSDPTLIGAGFTGKWTISSGTGTFANSNSYNTTVTGMTIGTINKYRWTINGIPSCGTSFDEVNITIPTAPNAFAGNDQTICPGASTILTASAGVGYSYLWSTTQTTQSITVTPAASTNYKLTVTDATKCQAKDDVNVNINNINVYNLTSNATSFCIGGTGVTLSLSGSEIGVNYQLKNGAANDGAAISGTGGVLTWINKTIGTYTIIATNTTSFCSKTMNGSILVTANPTPTIFNLTASSLSYCSYTSGVTLTLSGSENGANFQYQLYKNGTSLGIPLAGTGGALTWNNITTGNYSVTTTNTLTTCSGNMTGTPSITSIVSPAVFNVGGGGSYCELSGGLTVTLDGSEAGMKYQLIKDGLNSGGLVNGTAVALSWGGNLFGTYTIQATNAAATCTRPMNGSAVLTQIALPTVFNLTASAGGYCSGGSGVTLTLSGSQVGIDYVLLKNAAPVSTVSGTGVTLIWLNMTAGTYTAQAKTTGATVCSINITGSPVVTLYPLPAANAGVDKTICQQNSVQLGASGGTAYMWTPSTGLSNASIPNPVANPMSSVLYTVTVTDANGCSASDDVQVTVNVKPVANLSASASAICSGDSSQLSVSGGATYLWNTTSTSSSFWAKPLTTTYYSVIASNAFGCKDTVDFTLNVNSTPTVNAGSDKTICKGASVTINASGADTYIWNTGAIINSITVSPAVSANYSVTGKITATGCQATDNVLVTVNPLPAATFTLNGGVITSFCVSNPLVTLAGNPNAGGTFTSSAAGAISGNFFDPATSGAGPHTITYTYTDAKSCTNSVTTNVSVVALPVVNISGLNATYCSNSPSSTITGTPFQNGSGVFGTWTFSGPAAALTDNGDGTGIFNPAFVIASGNYTITYKVANASGCFNTATKSFTVNIAPNVSFVGLPNSICQSSTPVILTGNMVPSGIFTGLGITDHTDGTATYSASGYIPNNYSVTYTYQDPITLCSSSFSKVISVKLSPATFSITGGGTYCQGNAGLPIGLSNSTNNIAYELFLNGYTTSQTLLGNGAALSFGNKTTQGTYTIVATDPINSCIQTMAGSSALIMDPLPADAQAITGVSQVCPGTSHNYSLPAILNTNTYQWQLPINAYITAGSGTNSITVFFAPNAASGNIVIYGQNACGNGLSSTMAVSVAPLPAVAGAISGSVKVCKGETNVIYSIVALSYASSYNWTIPSGATLVSGQGTPQIIVSYPSSSASGNISVNGVNSCGNGTISSKAITVVPAPQLTVNAPSGQITCAVTPVAVSATSSTAGASFVWTGINGGHIVAGANTPNPSVDAVGDYIITLTEPVNSCTSIDTVTVLPDNAVPQNVNITSTNAGIITCSIAQVTLTAGTSSVFPTGYSWTSAAGGNIVSGVNTASAIVDKGSVYQVKVTNLSNDCFTLKSITITESKAFPNVSVIDPETEKLTCTQSTVTLSSSSVTSGVTYSWSGPGTILNSNTTTPVVDAAGTYTITVTAINGCSTSNTVWVQSDNSVPTININTPSSLNCTNATITLNGSSTTAGAILLWTGPGIGATPANQTQVISLPGNYILTVTHPLTGCNVSQIINITQDLSVPVINFPVVAPAITCNLPTSNLTSTTIPANSILLWTGSGSISNITIANPIVNAPGNYSLRATHPTSGCISNRMINVADGRTVANVNIAAPLVITCSVPSITLKGTTTLTNYTALWTTANGIISGSPANLDVVVTKDGTYTLTITNNTSGCIVSKNVTVTADTAPPDITLIDKNPALLTCTVSKVTLNGASITPGATLMWIGPAGANITDPTAPDPKVDAIGTYTLTITSTNGCTSSDIVTVSENKTSPTVPSILSPQQITCSRTSVQVELSPLMANTDYLWTTSGAGIIINSTDPIAIVNAIGSYTLKVTNRTSGCTNQNSVTVSMDNATSFTAITGGPYTLSCALPSLVLDGSTSTGNNPVWTATLGGHIVSNGSTFKPTIDAVGTYTITTSDATTGCTSSASISVTSAGSLPSLTIDPFPTKLNCSVTNVTLSGKPTEAGTTYTWTASPGNFVSGSTTFNPVVDQPGTYILTVTKTATGCVNNAAIQVEQDISVPALSISLPAKITCTTNQVQLNTSTTASSVSYLWSTSGTGTIRLGDNNVSNPLALSAGIYLITIRDLNNQCSAMGSVSVTEDKTIPDITVNKTPSQLTCINTDVTLSGNSITSGAMYQWSTAGSGTIISPTSKSPRVDAPEIYTLTINNPANGCSVSDNVAVTRDNISPNIWVDTNPVMLNCTVINTKISGNSSTPNVTYAWSGPGNITDPTLKEPNVDAPGTYNLTITSIINGCNSTLPVTVTQNKSVPAAPISSDDYTCYNSVSASLSAAGSNIKWYGDASLLSASKLHDGNIYTPASVTAVGNYFYFATQTDPVSQCESPATMVTYSIKALPAQPAIKDGTICQGTANPALQATGTNINWYNLPGGMLLGSGGLYTPPASVSASGTYNYYATQTDASNCVSATTLVKLTINPIPAKPVMNRISSTICEGSANTIYTASGNSVKWYDNSLLPAPIATGNTFTSTEITPGVYTYYITQTSTQGCTSLYETITFTISSPPQQFNITGGGIYCEDQNGIIAGLDGSELNSVSKKTQCFLKIWIF